MTGILTRRGTFGDRQTDRHTEHPVKTGLMLPPPGGTTGLEQVLPSQPSGGASLAHTLISDFWPLEPQDKTFLLFQPPSWWCSVPVTLARAEQAGNRVAGHPERACWAAAGGGGGQYCTHKTLGPAAPRRAPLCIFSRCAFSFSSLWGRTVSSVEFAAHV